jgi:hypothetical protein
MFEIISVLGNSHLFFRFDQLLIHVIIKHAKYNNRERTRRRIK